MTSKKYSPDSRGELFRAHVVDDEQIELEVASQALVVFVDRFLMEEVTDDITATL